MIARARGCGQFLKSLAAGLVVKMVVPEHEGIAVRQARERVLQHRVIVFIAQQPQGGQGIGARH